MKQIEPFFNFIWQICTFWQFLTHFLPNSATFFTHLEFSTQFPPKHTMTHSVPNPLIILVSKIISHFLKLKNLPLPCKRSWFFGFGAQNFLTSWVISQSRRLNQIVFSHDFSSLKFTSFCLHEIFLLTRSAKEQQHPAKTLIQKKEEESLLNSALF